MTQDERSSALHAEYAEAASAFALLTDIRFKLLAFLPLGSAAAAAVLSRQSVDPSTLAFALFGFVVTLALVTYNTRNDQLYDALVARLAHIERELGLPDGAFAVLVPVVDCRVENVGPEFDRARDGLSIARVLDCRGVAQVRPETD